MPKLFQIHEEDLATLEHTLPALADGMMPQLDNRARVQWRRVQEILSKVRWSYGPPTDVTVIPADDGQAPG